VNALEHHNKTFCIEVEGPFACFTRPEMKVERVSYDVITPSAARAVFEAIFWKPAIRWQVRKIQVLNPIRWTSVRRNEVGVTMSPRSDGIYIEDQRQQRAGLFLRDVRYRLHAELLFIPPAARKHSQGYSKNELIARQFLSEEEKTVLSSDENPGKYNAIFERRARKGQCFNQPYLGCREFSCSFGLIEDPNDGTICIPETRDLGFMLYDLDYSDLNTPAPMFFRAQMNDGVVMVPDPDSEEVKR
jgi:CRISPR-associated protein Cas5d